MSETIIRSGEEAVVYVGKQLCDRFNLDDPARREIYRKAYYCFSSIGKKEIDGIKTEKALLLVGNIGVGKTTLMAVMQRLFKDTERKFKWVTTVGIKDMLEECKVAEIKDWYGKNLKCDLYIDDIGFGQVNYNQFGNYVNIISEIIYDRYELFVSEGFKTHMSSNVPTTVRKDAPATFKSLERMYGDRILDRVAQMTNLITWQGKTLRRE